MGSSGSKEGKSLLGKSSKKRGGSDSLIGNRKVRTIIISGVLIIVSIMFLPYLFDQQKYFQDFSDSIFSFTCSNCDALATGYSIIIAGAFTIIASAIFAILLFFIDCDNNVGRIAGALLIIGGFLFLIGWIYVINEYNSFWQPLIENLPQETQDRYNAQLTAWIGEALLIAGMAALLGLDVFMHVFDDEAKRLFMNLAILCVVSVMCWPVYYILTNGNCGDIGGVTIQCPDQNDGYPWIGTGYAILFGFTLAYIILFIFTCCTCDCKDTKCVRLLVALGLIVGGIFTAIGYYIYAGDFTSSSADNLSDYTVYYIGYTIAIVAFPVIWAIDIGIDDIKG